MNFERFFEQIVFDLFDQIVMAMIVYQYESWKKKNVSRIQLVNL